MCTATNINPLVYECVKSLELATTFFVVVYEKMGFEIIAFSNFLFKETFFLLKESSIIYLYIIIIFLA